MGWASPRKGFGVKNRGKAAMPDQREERRDTRLRRASLDMIRLRYSTSFGGQAGIAPCHTGRTRGDTPRRAALGAYAPYN